MGLWCSVWHVSSGGEAEQIVGVCEFEEFQKVGLESRNHEMRAPSLIAQEPKWLEGHLDTPAALRELSTLGPLARIHANGRQTDSQ
jgi:hypothetical protein